MQAPARRERFLGAVPGELRDRDAEKRFAGTKVASQVGVAALILLAVLATVFLMQNVEDTEIRMFGWSAEPPLVAALTFAAILGAAITLLAVWLRARSIGRKRSSTTDTTQAADAGSTLPAVPVS